MLIVLGTASNVGFYLLCDLYNRHVGHLWCTTWLERKFVNVTFFDEDISIDEDVQDVIDLLKEGSTTREEQK